MTMTSDRPTHLERAERIVPLLSHVAQIGLFALTAWGLFHTVVPLYQKAVVDEQVAKQQAELKQLATKFNDSYAKIRRQTVLEFSYFSVPDCTGLLQPVALELDSKSSHKGPLDIDIHSCLNLSLESFVPKGQLSEVDRTALAAAVDKVGRRLDEIRLAERLEVDRLKPADASKGPVALGPFSPFFLDEIKRAGALPQQIKDAENNMSLRYQQNTVESRYLNKVQKQVSDLVNLKWPKPEDSDLTAGEP